jgi:hypothetical protein
MEKFFNYVTVYGRSTDVDIFNVIFQIVSEDPEKKYESS